MDKNFEPQIVQELPFPGQILQPDYSSKGVQGDFSPITSQPNVFPRKRIAVELLSSVLNTKSRKILKEFQLQQSGGFQVGDFKEGLSGDIRITPDGLVARNIAGLPTVTIDGDTGDATFSGDVRASTFTSDFFNVDLEGNVVAESIQIVSEVDGSEDESNNQSITSTSEVQITGSSITFSLPRPTIILILLSWTGYCLRASGIGDWQATGSVNIRINGINRYSSTLSAEEVGGVKTGDLHLTNAGGHWLGSVSAGDKTIDLAGIMNTTTNNGSLTVYGYKLSFISLGNS